MTGVSSPLEHHYERPLTANMSSIRCLRTVGALCGLIGGDCRLAGSSIGAACELKNALVCKPTTRCLRAVTPRRLHRRGVRPLPRRSRFATPGYAEYYVAGGAFPAGAHPLRVNSPCDLSAKPGFLAVCIAPHRYRSGPAVSPQECILLTRRPKGSWPAWTGDGTFHPFHRRASWRTNQTLSSRVARPCGMCYMC
jgi:hypothetical protein